MKETFDLWEETPGKCISVPVIDAYIPDEKKSDGAVILLPGGAYGGRAKHEGEGYAEFLNSIGITAFVCQYRVSPHRFPLPLLDARRAVRFVRYNAVKYGLDKNKIFVMGSSAGGHLAALASTYTKPVWFENMDEIDKEDFLPNGQILCYPVIKLSGDEFGGINSGRNFLGEEYAEMQQRLTPDLIADETAPRAFIWHTFNDEQVNVINSLDYAKRLRTVGGEVEMHIYPDGPHGLGLAKDFPHVAEWSDALKKWFEYIGFMN